MDETLGDVIALISVVVVVILEGGMEPLAMLKLVSTILKVVEKLAHPRCKVTSTEFNEDEADFTRTVTGLQDSFKNKNSQTGRPAPISEDLLFTPEFD